jgi:hypothetical protein
MKLDAYEISDKIKKYWCALYPKNSGELLKTKTRVMVVVNTSEGLREVVGVHIVDDKIQLELDNE